MNLYKPAPFQRLQEEMELINIALFRVEKNLLSLS